MSFKNFDFYRNIPKDLTETTSHGALMSICATIFMITLFFLELWAFLSPVITTDVIIDPSTEAMLRINFNITTMDTPCEFATIDIVDILGTRNENVTKNINKWQVDENGVRRNYEGRNREQKDLEHDTHHDLEVLNANGIHAVNIDEKQFDVWTKTHRFTFVNFYAPWCVWCQRLEPVWEAFAERAEAEKMPISIVKVDCVANRELCVNQRVQAFPLLRFFKEGEPVTDYRSDRTVDAFAEFVKTQLSQDEQFAKMNEQQRQLRLKEQEAQKTEHPGCMLSGFLLVNRVPGNFHIESRSKHHNLNPVMANLSHIVNHLSFGQVLSKSAVNQLEQIPSGYFSFDKTHLIDDKVFANDKYHQAFHHYIKVVSTLLSTNPVVQGDAVLAYQMIHSSQIMQYGDDDVPEARFSYDISPMSVLVKSKGKKLYEFLTSICAVIGGTFTVVGLFNGFLGVIFKSKKI